LQDKGIFATSGASSSVLAKIRVVEVRFWGTTIGRLGYAPMQREAATFEYTAEFAESGLQVIAPVLIHSFPDISQQIFKGLSGIVSDKFGNQIMIFLWRKKILHRTQSPHWIAYCNCTLLRLTVIRRSNVQCVFYSLYSTANV